MGAGRQRGSTRSLRRVGTLASLLVLFTSACVAPTSAGPNRAAPVEHKDAPWSARMGWRFISYREGEQSVSFQIDPMVSGPDWVYFPDVASWDQHAPAFFRGRRDEVQQRLSSVKWKRELAWKNGHDFMSMSVWPVPGSIESTKGGAEVERMNLFGPESQLTSEQAREIWLILERRFAEQARGEVHIFVDREPLPDSVLQRVSLPTLRKNPNVTKVDVRSGDPQERSGSAP